MSLNQINWVEEWSCTWCPCYSSKQTNAWKCQRLCLHPSRPLKHFISDASSQGCIDSPIVNFHFVPLTSNRRSVFLLTPTLRYQFALGWSQARMATGYDNIWSDDLQAVIECSYFRVPQILNSCMHVFFFLISQALTFIKLWWAIIKKSTCMTSEKTCTCQCLMYYYVDH